jgi:hypothetical protein
MSGSTPPTTTGGGGGNTQSAAEQSIAAANALGQPMSQLANFNAATLIGSARRTMTANGACASGVELFAPDKNGDPNSTEAEIFYDSACTQLARDTVRIYNINGTSETANVTEKLFAINNATPIAVKTSTESILNGTYGSNGFPLAADGFARSNAATLDISGAKTLLNDDELVLGAQSSNINSFCSDGAGYNATGFAKLNETFGWQGTQTSGTRTTNSDGSVTWAATHTGSNSSGAIGSLSINSGSANTTCPISTPEYVLAGGTVGGTFSIPYTATYMGAQLESLTVTNGTLSNGNTINVSTDTSLTPSDSNYITGTVANGSTQIATFAVNAFGNGTLTVTSTGAQFVITDFQVVR